MSTALARSCARAVDLRPGLTLHLAVEGPELVAGLGSLVESSGSILVDAEAAAVIVELQQLPERLVPRRVCDALEAARPGAAIAVLVRKRPKPFDEQAVLDRWRPVLGMEQARAELLDEGLLLRGARWERLSNAEVKRLRGIGHQLEPSVLIGRAGLTDEVVEAVRAGLLRHGLLKVKLTPQCDMPKDDAARALAWATGSRLVQRIGKTALLRFTEAPLDPPVSRRGRGR